ncbi:MAG: hypothetical protein EXS77_04420 [Nitrosopumilus sp.]|nr:hypothetical protein [Nitrosopumilus sp.]
MILPMTNFDYDTQHFKTKQLLQEKHDVLFEKIVYAQRENNQFYAESYAKELTEVRYQINLENYLYLKKKWGDMYHIDKNVYFR